MKLYHKLSQALEHSGLPPLKRPTAYRKIGSGAWHDAYLVHPARGERLVIRLRKQIIYGRQEAYDEQYLREDYEPVGLYYRLANRCRPGVCPAVYTYDLNPDLTFTVESYMGRSLALAKLTIKQARAYGQQVGYFFRAMHQLRPSLSGFGYLVWNRTGLQAEKSRSVADIWRAEVETLWQQFDELGRADLSFERTAVKRKLNQALAGRAFEAEPVVLVNRDVSPENLIARRRNFVGLVDPVPLLHNALRYASFFVYCYQSYLPNLYNAPRYARHQFQRYRSVMAALADGYVDGYTQGDDRIEENLRLEYYIWALQVAYENLQRLTAEPDSETLIRAGDKKAIAARLQRCLQELESYQLS
jgi:hypothetical protein